MSFLSNRKMHHNAYQGWGAAEAGAAVPPVPTPEENANCAECCHPQKTSPSSSHTSLRVETPQCTDRCIVVACDQPDHLDFDDILGHPCSALQCEQQACDLAHEWPCAEPNCEMNEMLQCCLNDIPPAHACTQSHLPTMSWDSCIAGQASIAHSHGGEHRDMSNFRCMWGSCNRSFMNQMELLSHVHSEHLHHFPGQDFHQYTASPTVNASSSDYGLHSVNPYYQDDVTQKAFACLWDDCGIEVPAHSQCSGFLQEPHGCDADYLLNHLLTNHFGLHASLGIQENPNATFTPQTPSDITATTQSTSSTATSNQTANESSTFPCEWQDCTACFSSCDDLNNHIADSHIGHGKSSYECLWKGCDRHGGNAFPSKQKIMRHVQKHTGFKPHVCTVCQEKFAETTSLQQHMRRHTQERPYVCDYPGCGKSFSIPGGLRIHKRAHSGEKPFKCPEPGCGKAFSESSNLAKHMRIHTGVKPFQCDHPGCGRRFGRKDQLLRHAHLHRGSPRQERAEQIAVAA